MCGIAGIAGQRIEAGRMEKAIDSLYSRGPDARGTFSSGNITLGHTRLAIIDTSEAARQPMTDESGRYTIVYNGEIFNFLELKKELLSSGTVFFSGSDTEVLLKLYIRDGQAALARLNGFFAFAILDSLSGELFLARDRFGVKPLYYSLTGGVLTFASETKALFPLGLKPELDKATLLHYLQLSYVPPGKTMLKGVQDLLPGHFLSWKPDGMVTKKYYSIPSAGTLPPLAHGDATHHLESLLDDSVRRRLIADVPLGCFLSGGIDSSVITALASRHTKKLKTYNIAFPDEPYFDESAFAEMVAKRYQTEHTRFELRSEDYLGYFGEMLDYLDQPFADPAMIAQYVLCKLTSGEVKVALSGDGCDELFGGYNKHRAELLARSGAGRMASLLKSVASALPQGRQSWISDKLRQARRFAEGAALPAKDRYWKWCTFADEQEAISLLLPAGMEMEAEYREGKEKILAGITSTGPMNEVFLTDMQLVLPGDMLFKVDRMSMASSLEVRNPFLDYRVVEFAFSLPPQAKVGGKRGKRIIRDAFSRVLPPEILNRPKHGFDVPVLDWFRGALRGDIESKYLSPAFVREQGIFNPAETEKLKARLFSGNPGDIETFALSVIVFQHWWRKWMA